jgi:hypothetical protein
MQKPNRVTPAVGGDDAPRFLPWQVQLHGAATESDEELEKAMKLFGNGAFAAMQKQ